MSTSREGATMKISSIISGKRVETISASASIHDLVNTLNSHHIGALVVSSDGKRIDGIVSERDVVRAMPGKLDQLIGMHVRDIMTVEVHTCTPDTTVAELMKMMTEHRIRHVPVVDAEGALLAATDAMPAMPEALTALVAQKTAASRMVDLPLSAAGAAPQIAFIVPIYAVQADRTPEQAAISSALQAEGQPQQQ